MESSDQHADQYHPLALAGIAVSGIIAGAALGGLTNSINGWVSPLYFRNVLHWQNVEDVWRASIAQGILEGLLFGIFLSLVFVVVAGIVSKARCTYRFGVTVLLAIVAAAFVCWLIGGVLGMGLASLSPEFFRHAFRGVPQDLAEMLRYAWVGGSIEGIEIGGFFLTILGSFFFYAKWRSQGSCVSRVRTN